MTTFPQYEPVDTIVQLRLELTRWQSLAESLATVVKDFNDIQSESSGVVGYHLNGAAATWGSLEIADSSAALAAYESAKSGNLSDPLDEAVKRMEEVPLIELSAAWDKTDVRGVRARLISAAKGEQP